MVNIYFDYYMKTYNTQNWTSDSFWEYHAVLSLTVLPNSEY